MRTSLTIFNACRTWSKENKIRTEVNEAQVVQDAWRLCISKEIRIRIILAQKKAEFACYENITYTIGVAVLFHSGVHSLHYAAPRREVTILRNATSLYWKLL